MSYTIERLFQPDAYLVQYEAGFGGEEEMLELYRKLIAYLEDEAQPITVIYDITRLSISLDDLMVSSRVVSQNQDINPARHPMNQQSILITEAALLRMSVEGFAKFGGAKSAIRAVTSLEAALQLIRDAA